MRRGITLLAALLCFATAGRAGAQARPGSAGIVFTPFAGYQIGWTRTSDATLFLDGVEREAVYEDRGAGGTAAGLRISIPVGRMLPIPSADGIAVVGAFTFSRNDGGYTAATVRDTTAGTLSAYGAQSSANVLTMKLGLGLRLPLALPSELTIAPTLVRVAPRHRSDDPLVRSTPVTHAGLNVGLDLDFPTTIRALTLQVAAEDNILYGNAEMAHRIDHFFAVQTGAAARSTFPRTPSHLGLLRAGLSFHF